MLLDLARNDINAFAIHCQLESTDLWYDICLLGCPCFYLISKTIQRFSYVQHITSEVSGVLRPEKTRFDAFR